GEVGLVRTGRGTGEFGPAEQPVLLERELGVPAVARRVRDVTQVLDRQGAHADEEPAAQAGRRQVALGRDEQCLVPFTPRTDLHVPSPSPPESDGPTQAGRPGSVRAALVDGG